MALPGMGMPADQVSGDPRWQLAQRIADSSHFLKAPRLRTLLLYVCEQTMLGQAENLTEQRIGHRIFERSLNYSPADDSIVRVQARQLRLRLAEYFRSEGKDEATIIEIPKGSYVAVFREAGAAVHVESRPGRRSLLGAPWFWIVAVALLGLAGACVALLLENRRLRAQTGEEPATVGALLLDAVFDQERVTAITIADSGFGMLQGFLDGRLTLEDYLNPGYPDTVIDGRLSPDAARWARAISKRPHVVFNKVLMAEQMAELGHSRRWRYAFRYARDLQMRDFAAGNHILVGSRLSNPWVELFEKGLCFQAEWDAAGDVLHFRNTSPRGGERLIYSSAGPNGVPGSAFAVVALRSSPDASQGSGKVLLLQGTNMEATEAAWDYVCRPIWQPEISSHLAGWNGASGGGRTIEVLLETRALAGSHDQVAVKAVRIH